MVALFVHPPRGVKGDAAIRALRSGWSSLSILDIILSNSSGSGGGMSILIYGATGYTGKLIARMARQLGMSVTLAGRNEAKLQVLAAETGFEHIAVDLDDAATLSKIVARYRVVLHVAGPFSKTAKPSTGRTRRRWPKGYVLSAACFIPPSQPKTRKKAWTLSQPSESPSGRTVSVFAPGSGRRRWAPWRG